MKTSLPTLGLRAGLAAVLVPSVVFAGVTDFGGAKIRLHVQGSAAPPGAPVFYLGGAEVIANPGDATTVTVNGLSLPEQDPGEFWDDVSFPTQASLDAVFPVGSTLAIQVQGGALGTLNDTLQLPSVENYPPAPALTAATMTALQNYDPAQSLLLQWNSGGAFTNTVFAAVDAVSNGSEGPEFEDPTGTATSLLIPAGTLSPNTQYEIILDFGNLTFPTGSPAPGFGVGAQGLVGIVSETLINFQTGGGIDAFCFGDGSGATCPCSLFGAAGAGCANTGGPGATMTGSGTPSFSNDTLSFSITGVPGNKPGLLLRGNNQVSVLAGDGILCIAGGSQSSQVQVTIAGSTVFTDFSGGGFGSVANPSAPTNFQFWYRDPQNSCSGAGFNFTNGVSVVYSP